MELDSDLSTRLLGKLATLTNQAREWSRCTRLLVLLHARVCVCVCVFEANSCEGFLGILSRLANQSKLYAINKEEALKPY